MKPYLAIAVVLSFMGIAVFGIFAMNYSGGAHSDCIAATVSGGPCPVESNPLASVAFHFDAFKNFSTATVVSFTTSLLLALTLVFALYALPGFQINFFPKQASFSKYLKEQSFPLRQCIYRWLALHENSPTLI